MGTTSLTAQALGANQRGEPEEIFWRSCRLALCLSLILYLLQQFLLPFCIQLMAPDNSVTQLALEYCRIRVLAAPAALINYVLIGWLIGCQDTRTPLLLMLVLNLSNIVLDMFLVWHLGWGSAGAAWASFCAEVITCCLGLAIIFRRIQGVSWGSFLRLGGWYQYRELLVVNGHLFIRTAVLLLVLLFFNAQSARLGESFLAANAILMQLVAIISYGLDGFAHAAEALVGRATGARNVREFKQACWITFLWALVTAVFISTVFWLLGPQIVGLFTDIESVEAIATNQIQWLPLLPLLFLAGYHLDGIFLGWGRAHIMQATMLMSALFVFLPVWWLGSGNAALWSAFTLFNVSRGALLLMYLVVRLRGGELWPKREAIN